MTLILTNSTEVSAAAFLGILDEAYNDLPAAPITLVEGMGYKKRPTALAFARTLSSRTIQIIFTLIRNKAT